VIEKVRIEYTLTPQKVVYVISDDGECFDYRNLKNATLETANNQLLSHGRGIAMTLNGFEEVIYNEKGNQVRLVKYFRD